MNIRKSLIERKGFALFALCFGITGLLLMAHHIVSYENILRPFMDYLIENRIITNDKSGIAFLRMFTNESNILVDIWLILYALGIFGNEKCFKLTHKEWLRGAITLNIAVTGIIYFTVLLPSSAPFPSEVNGVGTGGMWFSNIVNYWNHLITPVFFTACWFFPVEERKIPKVKYALIYLVYPVCYFIVSIILGAWDGFYPYPFLSGRQMSSMLPGLKDQPYNPVTGVLLLVAVVIILSGVFFGIGCALNAIHNKRAKASQEPEPETEKE